MSGLSPQEKVELLKEALMYKRVRALCAQHSESTLARLYRTAQAQFVLQDLKSNPPGDGEEEFFPPLETE